MGRRQEFADAFDASEEKKIALAGVERYAMITAEDLTLETQQELAVQRATTNGFFSTLWVLLKVQISTQRNSQILLTLWGLIWA